jgi:Protein of unknown function (DUF3347)
MKKVIWVLLIIILAIGGYYWYRISRSNNGANVPKQAPITLNKHSEAFNNSVSAAMNAYFDMSAAFVEADTAKVKEYDRKFIQLLGSIPMDELKKDTTNIYDIAMSFFADIKSNAASILNMTDIGEMRKDFKTLSENLYPSFFKTINYEGDKMYWQYCPMAFGDEQGANWISKTTETINPYLGKNHPEFKGSMLHCGMVKDTIKAQ